MRVTPRRRAAPGAMLSDAQIEKLGIVSYPDPVLRKTCAPITEFGGWLDRLTRRMFELMHAHTGVGLAGPQVGLPWRIFVWNPTGQPEDDAVCINPQLAELTGQEPAEEGCLSIDGVHVNVNRATAATIGAHQPDGSQISLRGEGLIARIWQHETDHLNGRLILDYMSPADEIANRKALKELRAKYQPIKARKRKRRLAR
jgi:peptide deformylase